MRICRKSLVLSLVATVALTAAILSDFSPKLVWNGSQSAPLGFYVVRQRPAEVGDYVLLSPPKEARALIEKRGYLPPETPLIKRVAGDAGDEICRDGERILINDVIVARALLNDSMNRPMPEWSGCFILRGDEIFLLNDHQNSLDGRYFGATRRENIIGVAAPVWMSSSDDRIGE